MSLSARRILRPSCLVAVLPSRRSTVITEPAYSNERVELTDSTVEQTFPVDHALINGAEHSPHQYVSTVTFLQLQNVVLLTCIVNRVDELSAVHVGTVVIFVAMSLPCIL